MATRIEAGGTLNNTPPTVIGSAGASGATLAAGQRGHSTSATNAAPPMISTTSARIANARPADALRFLRAFGCVWARSVIDVLCAGSSFRNPFLFGDHAVAL